MNDEPSANARKRAEIQRLLTLLPLVKSACDLDLLVFFYRHPRSLLTNEQLAAFVGYDTKVIAECIDAFVTAGVLERAQNPMHAARMYLFRLESPQMGGLKELVDLARTYEGRKDILQVLVPETSGPSGSQTKRRLHVA